MKSYQNTGFASSDESSKETPKEASDEETPIPEPGGSADAEQEINSAPEPEQPNLEKTADEKPKVSGEIFSEAHADGEDGWQPVQRPRSAGSYGRRLKQRRATISKIYSYQKKNTEADMDYPLNKSANQNSRYYFLKKRTISHGGHTDNHTMNITQGTKFGRKVVKAVTYRVKSTPPSSKTDAEDTTAVGDKLFNSHLEPDSNSTSTDVNPVKASIVSLGKSPSYKEVALAPPGTISKLQVYNPQSEISVSQGYDVGKHDEEEDIEGNSNANLTSEELNDKLEEKENSLSDSLDDSQEDIKVAEEKEEPQLIDAEEDKCDGAEGLDTGDVEAHEAVDNTPEIDTVDDTMDSHKQELGANDSSGNLEFHDNTNAISQGGGDLRVNSPPSNLSDSRGIPYKKLSASAAPFNPSPAIARAAPVAMNITLSSGPGTVPIGPWPVNMNVHPGPATVLPTVNPMCSSPHHAYPSPPPTPNIIQPLPFMYPTYTQPQSVPTSTFPVTSSAFHANHFTWQCNVNPTVSKFGPNAVWPGCHPVEFPLPAPVIQPIPDPILEPQVQCHGSESPSSVSLLPEDIDNVRESKKEVTAIAPETTENEVIRVGSESIHESGSPSFNGTENTANKPSQIIGSSDNTSSSDMIMDGEKTFSILIRGRRNRKQTLRMPISLLNKPYGSQSFKVIYNRVVRGSDAPKSINIPTSKDCTATA